MQGKIREKKKKKQRKRKENKRSKGRSREVVTYLEFHASIPSSLVVKDLCSASRRMA